MTGRLAFALAVLPGLAHAQSLSVSHQFTGPVDGTAWGDVDGDGRLELAVITRQGTGPAAVRVLDDNGAQLLGISSAAPLGGFPVLADFDGDQLDEPAYCELHHQGMCRILDLDGTVLAQFGPFYFPGMTTAGPAAADVNGDGRSELVIATYGGLVAAVSTQGVLWQADTWRSHGEMYFGHPVVDDIDGDGQLEVVVAGARRGSVIAFDARTGQIEWEFLNSYGQFGNYAYANGTLATDMNGDGKKEIIVALVANGEGHAVFAFDAATGTLQSRLALPGADLSYMTPVALDTHTAGGNRVYLQGGEGILRRLAFSGGNLSVAGQLNLGQPSWVSPAFVDGDGDGVFEILASTTNSLVFIDPSTMSAAGAYASATGGLMPTSVTGDANRDGRVDIITASWWGQSLLRLELDSQTSYSWNSLGGGAKRGGTFEAPYRPSGSSSLSFEFSSEWSVTTGSGTLAPTPHATDGAVGMSITGSGFIEIESPTMTTEMIQQNTPGGVPRRALLDVLVQPGQPNPYWLGAIQLYIEVPSAGQYHRYIGQQALSQLTIGEYGQLSFKLPKDVEATLLGSHQDVRLSIAVNIPFGAPPLIIDNLRFAP